MDQDAATASDDDEGAAPWVLLGTIGAGGRVHLDRHGGLRPENGAWSLDWGVRAEDRWHIASDGALVRQSLIDSTPVVVSALRVPGGEIEQRAWCTVEGSSGAPLLVAEFHNATAVPVALALALRCGNGSGTNSAQLVTFDGSVVAIDGNPIARFSREPSRYAYATDGRSTRQMTIDEDAVSAFPVDGVIPSGGDDDVAFVFPLPHTATLRVAFSIVDIADTVGERNVALRSLDLSALAPHDRVVAGWKTQLARSPRFDLPERGIEDAVDGARAHLLVHVAAEEPLRAPGIAIDGVERAELAMTLDEQGLFAEAERLISGSAELQHPDGSFDAERLDATASWIVAAGRHFAFTGDAAFAATSLDHLVSATHWLAKRQRGSALRHSTRFFGRGSGPGALSSEERVAYDARWTRRAFLASIDFLSAAGETSAATAVRSQLDELIDQMARRSISPDGPGGDGGERDAIAVLRSELLEGEPLWSWAGPSDAHDPARTARFLRNVRSIVASDSADGVDLVPGFGERWLGQSLSVLRLPSTIGTVSFALRWHGARPALLWEVEGDRSGIITCSAIDPEWSTSELRGEALLAAPVFDHVHVDHDVDHVAEGPPNSVAEPPVQGGGSFT